MSGEPNFLSRWARLKHQSEVRRARQSEPAAQGTAEPAKTAEQAQPETTAIPELPPEELADLPRLEDLTPETDLAPFLRAGVPAGLRNAALRRMWALDPAIRDRVGDALDYAYDWNVPGSVPGSGPLLASDDVQAMLRTIVGPPQSEGGGPPSANAEAVANAAEAQSEASADPLVEEAAEAAEEPTADVRELPARADETATETAKPEPKRVAQVRRHGRATPF
jgi:Protein of unknown function (DUF3306)